MKNRSIICFLVGLPGKGTVCVAHSSFVVVILQGCRVICCWVICAVLLLEHRPVGMWWRTPSSASLLGAVGWDSWSFQPIPAIVLSLALVLLLVLIYRRFHPCCSHSCLTISVTELYLFTLPLALSPLNLPVTALGSGFGSIKIVF